MFRVKTGDVHVHVTNELAQYDGDAPPEAKPVWRIAPRDLTGKLVSQRRLWFDPCVQSPSRMHKRSTHLTEQEAIAWAARGLLRRGVAVLVAVDLRIS